MKNFINLCRLFGRFYTQLLFEFEFTHARIVAMEPLSETTESLPGQEYEKIRFIYSTITVRDIAAGTEVVWTLAGWPT